MSDNASIKLMTNDEYIAARERLIPAAMAHADWKAEVAWGFQHAATWSRAFHEHMHLLSYRAGLIAYDPSHPSMIPRPLIHVKTTALGCTYVSSPLARK